MGLIVRNQWKLMETKQLGKLLMIWQADFPKSWNVIKSVDTIGKCGDSNNTTIHSQINLHFSITSYAFTKTAIYKNGSTD